MPGEKIKPKGEYTEGYARMTGSSTDSLLPSMTDPYKAAGFSDEVSCLVLIMGASGFKPGGTAYVTLQYVHIGLGEFGFTPNGQRFRFVFSDIQPKLVTVHGRNLLRIYHHIGLRRMRWIRQADRDFRPADAADDNEPIITRIEVTDWLRLGDQGGGSRSGEA